MLKRNRLVGALGVGEWRDSQRLQIAVARQQRIMPWQLWSFIQTGSLWRSEDLADASAWPAAAPICQCRNVTRGVIGDAISAGARSVETVAERTGATTVCGSCRPLIQQLLGAGAIKAVDFWRFLLASAAVSLVLVALMSLLPPIPFAQTVQVEWRWDELWRDGLLKQISGFSILGLFLVGLLVSPRKRLRALQMLGRFDYWRLLHVALGALVVFALLAHTGMRFGYGLDRLLMVSFVGTLLLGGLSTGVIALEHKIGGALATRWRRNAVWWHILLFWPVPVALGFHVLKTYFY
jgi:nitrite reductase (NADH) large subunit